LNSPSIQSQEPTRRGCSDFATTLSEPFAVICSNRENEGEHTGVNAGNKNSALRLRHLPNSFGKSLAATSHVE